MELWGDERVLAPHMVRYILTVTVALSSAATAANAMECRAELPSARTEYWSWRIVDGKRCWYPGRPGKSKANLHWRSPPAGEKGEGAQPKSERDPVPSKVEKVQPKVDDLPFAERWPH